MWASHLTAIPDSVNERAGRLLSLEAERRNTYISQRFVWLLLFQWVVAIAAAIWLTPYTWAGAERSLHPHVWMAVLGGGVSVLVPIWLAVTRPAEALTRHAVAIGQMLVGCLFIHLLGGRLEGHFHIFGSLAFLTSYRDWRVLITGSFVVLVDHILRGAFFPLSIYGVAGGAEWRWVEHAGWVVFEDAFLILASVAGLREMANGALRLAQLEHANDTFEHAVSDRTSELLAMTDQLRGSEERYRTFWENSPDPILLIDGNGVVADANPRAIYSLGYGPDELIGKRYSHINPSFDLRTVLRNLAEGHGPEMTFGFHRRKDETIFPVEVTYRRSDMSDVPYGMLTCRDVTERSKAEAALRASEERHRALFESIPHPMYVSDAATKRLLAVNGAAIVQYGYSRDEFLTMTTGQLERPGDRKARRVGESDAYGISFVRTCRHQLKCGTVRQVEVADHAITFDGAPAVVSLAIDVTDKVNLEQTLKQAQKLESIGQLAAGIAHEINTPIQYIGDNTTFLNDAFGELLSAIKASNATVADFEFLSVEIPKAVEQTLDGVQHVSRIVKAMKDFAHPGTEEKTPLDLNRAIENVITVAKNEWKYSAEVVTDLDPSLPPVPALPGELNQVFLNLLVNAVHAIQESGKGGKGTITITTRRVSAFVEVRVSDTGCGIPDKIRDRVFDPFFTTKPVGQGTGQGLSIAHAVVTQRHGGTISFTTEIGLGTVFVVTLPVTAPPSSSRSGRIAMISVNRTPSPAPDASPAREVSA